MKSNVRRTFRPTLEVMEDRLVPSSFQWGAGRGIANAAVLTAAQPAVGLTLPPGPAEIVVTKDTDIVLHRVRDLKIPAGPTTVVTAASGMYMKFDGLPSESISLNFTKVE